MTTIKLMDEQESNKRGFSSSIYSIFIMCLIFVILLGSERAWGEPGGLCHVLYITEAVRNILPSGKLSVKAAIRKVRREMLKAVYVEDVNGDQLNIPGRDKIIGDCEDLTAYFLIRAHGLGVPLEDLGMLLLNYIEYEEKSGIVYEIRSGHVLPMYKATNEKEWRAVETTNKGIPDLKGGDMLERLYKGFGAPVSAVVIRGLGDSGSVRFIEIENIDGAYTLSLPVVIHLLRENVLCQ